MNQDPAQSSVLENFHHKLVAAGIPEESASLMMGNFFSEAMDAMMEKAKVALGDAKMTELGQPDPNNPDDWLVKVEEAYSQATGKSFADELSAQMDSMMADFEKA